jgi:DNA-binding HxlR family transcriptional regulator
MAPGYDAPVNERATRETSPLDEALSAVGDRWSLLIVDALLAGPHRFADLRGEVQGIAPNILSGRLRRLQEHGVVVARRYSERPPRASYELTDEGRALAGALRLLAGWGARQTGAAEGPRHPPCGTPMEAVWYCPTCERPAGDEEDELRFV